MPKMSASRKLQDNRLIQDPPRAAAIQVTQARRTCCQMAKSLIGSAILFQHQHRNHLHRLPSQTLETVVTSIDTGMPLFLTILLFIAAVDLVVFGLAVIFSPRFIEYMRKTFWHKTEYDKSLFGKWGRLDEIVNVGLASIFTGVAIFVFLYYMI